MLVWTHVRSDPLSCRFTFLSDWLRSGFLVMGACSALTHTVLGQVKAVVTIFGRWLLFGQVYPPKAIAGALTAIVAMVLYTKYTL